MHITTTASLGLLTLCVIASACADNDANPIAPLAPRAVNSVQSNTTDTIPNSYIVVFTKSAASSPSATTGLATRLNKLHGGKMAHLYEYLGGYQVDNVPAAVAEALRHEPGVAYVEPNVMVHPAYVQQFNPGNGLDRLDQISLPLDQSFSYAYDGTGVHVYILDTGVDTTGGEFAGRIGQGIACALLAFGKPYESNDSYGHGTAVASLALGTKFGVAKKAILHSMRISAGSAGSASAGDTECAINWIAGHAIRPAVANWSFGGYPNAFSTRDAIQNLTVSAGISFVKAAGNEARDAWQDRANRATLEWVVGALDPTNDFFASFSDYAVINEPTVNMIAPGVNVLVADKFNPGFGKIGSGTSFAAPYLTGVIAQYLQVSPTATTQTVYDAINNFMTTYGSVQGIGGVAAATPNKELHSVLWCVPTC
jgi:subtilisin family serine protease